MSLNFKAGAVAAATALRRMGSLAFWLQLGACAVVAWSLFHGAPAQSPATQAPARSGTAPGAAPRPAAAPASPAQSTAPPRTASSGTASSGTASPDARTSGTAGSDAASAVRLAAAPTLEDARLALSSIDVIVSRNDTLDRIFRRLKLNIADLASLRALPGLKAHLDSLRPGESLHFTHKDGELFGLNRRLNDAETLQVTRSGDALKADVVVNPLESRTRTVGGRIYSSLFEAVAGAG